MPILIRELEIGDFDKGFLETLDHMSKTDLSIEEAIVVWRVRCMAGVRTLVAEIEGRVVGTASLILEQKYIHKGGMIGHIEDVAVHPGYNGKGVGSELVRHLTKLATDLRCYKVILSCFDDLVPFYSRLGFRKYDNGMRYDCPLPGSKMGL
jgi:glucosamine-phosphate N-acetyltransferase